MARERRRKRKKRRELHPPPLPVVVVTVMTLTKRRKKLEDQGPILSKIIKVNQLKDQTKELTIQTMTKIMLDMLTAG